MPVGSSPPPRGAPCQMSVLATLGVVGDRRGCLSRRHEPDPSVVWAPQARSRSVRSAQGRVTSLLAGTPGPSTERIRAGRRVVSAAPDSDRVPADRLLVE